jgi:hypothetical protein
VALEIAYHAGGLSKYEITKKWTELIWDVDGLKRLLAEGKLHNNTMCSKFLLALELQDEVAPRKGVRQIIRIYGTSPGNCHHDNGVQWRKIDVHMFKGTIDHVLTYFKCQAGKNAKEGEAGFATLKGTQSLTMNAKVSESKAVDGFCYQHQFQGQSSDGAGISLVTDYASDFDAVALAAHHKSEALRLGVIKEGHEEEERMPPPAALQNLFQKQADKYQAEEDGMEQVHPRASTERWPLFGGITRRVNAQWWPLFGGDKRRANAQSQ